MGGYPRGKNKMNYILYLPYNFLRQGFRIIRRKLIEFLFIFKKQISVHPSTQIGFHAKVQTIGGGSIKIGKNCSILDYAMILTYGGKIEIGNNVSIHHYSIIYGTGGLKIGNDVRIAAHVVITPVNHIFARKDIPIRLQGVDLKGIVIEDDVWIGTNVTILDGVTIGKGCVIGAGSVVTKSLPEYSVAVGIPARVIYKRGEKR